MYYTYTYFTRIRLTSSDILRFFDKEYLFLCIPCAGYYQIQIMKNYFSQDERNENIYEI